MKILHIVAGGITGGAGRGAYWLHEGLLNNNIDSKILTNTNYKYDDFRISTVLKTKLDKLKSFFYQRLEQYIFSKTNQSVLFSTGFFGIDFLDTNEYKEADIIHLHWINNCFIDIKDLKKIDKPIVWTLRDMWPMTGGCHYALECDNYKIGCGNCIPLDSKREYDLSRLVFNRKKKNIPKHIKIVGSSNWIANQAKKSALFKEFSIYTINNNIKLDYFFPIDKYEARKMLNLNLEKNIILVGSQSIAEKYKGFGLFLESLEYLNLKDTIICFFGNLENSLKKSFEFEFIHFGYIQDNISLRLIYNCADVYVLPSIVDTSPKTPMEAMACATPTVCFDTTGQKDIITHKADGYLAQAFDTKDLANGIDWILQNKDYKQLSKRARNKVIKEFDSDIVAQRYIELYRNILKV